MSARPHGSFRASRRGVRRRVSGKRRFGLPLPPNETKRSIGDDQGLAHAPAPPRQGGPRVCVAAPEEALHGGEIWPQMAQMAQTGFSICAIREICGKGLSGNKRCCTRRDLWVDRQWQIESERAFLGAVTNPTKICSMPMWNLQTAKPISKPICALSGHGPDHGGIPIQCCERPALSL